uniref:Anoctamin transmembrane domain-containing protein n=1 Tax=Kalanchoe fedtschenkoi TaxID=63787 RepID=A0A7N0VI89_KALFE
MNGGGEEVDFEIGIVVPKKSSNDEDLSVDGVEVLVEELRKAGLVIERVQGLSDEFIKLAAPLETLGRVAAEITLKKRTKIGMDLAFEWEEVDAFVRQPDGSLFSWSERFRCYRHLIYGILNCGKSSYLLRSHGKEFHWNVGESLLMKLESEGIVKRVFPLHVETTRKRLLRNWALNWWDFTEQPINEIQSYFGTKIATYFAFLGMYTRWMLFPAVLGVVVQLVDFGSLQLLVLPVFFICVTLWAIIFFQFWKRKNSALLARWQLGSVPELDEGGKLLGIEGDPVQIPVEFLRNPGTDIMKVKKNFQRNEWFGFLMRFRNDAIIILSIICLQLPFELAYAHLYEIIGSDIAKFGLTAIYLVAIQYFTQIGGRISVRLIKKENNRCSEYQANSLVYKVYYPNHVIIWNCEQK